MDDGLVCLRGGRCVALLAMSERRVSVQTQEASKTEGPSLGALEGAHSDPDGLKEVGGDPGDLKDAGGNPKEAIPGVLKKLQTQGLEEAKTMTHIHINNLLQKA